MKRTAFTLVELLVVIAIIGILASVFLGAMYAAQDTAKKAKTRSTLLKLNAVITEKYEAYIGRRIPITLPSGASPEVAARMRLTALRQLMLWEMPDRFNEVPAASVTSQSYSYTWGNPTRTDTIVVPRPSVSLAYARRIGTPSNTTYQGAELLYQIVMMAGDDDDSPAENFKAGEIGDKDEDGLREFKDGWNNPISFVRWPAGFASELIDTDPVKSHDQFDPRKVHPEAYQLRPLVFSPGPDEEYEINNDTGYAYTTNASGILDPYKSSTSTLIGDWTDTNGDGVNDTIDNIHNHLIGAR